MNILASMTSGEEAAVVLLILAALGLLGLAVHYAAITRDALQEEFGDWIGIPLVISLFILPVVAPLVVVALGIWIKHEEKQKMRLGVQSETISGADVRRAKPPTA